VITDWETFERYPWPQGKDADFYPITYTSARLPEGMGLIAEVTGVLEPVMTLIGYETFALALYDEPDLIQAVFDRIEEIYTPIVRTVVQMDRVVALWIGDDMGFKTGTMISPDHLRRYVFPIHKRYARIAHEHGKPYMLHSCGNLEAVMNDLIEYVKIDAKHSFEDAIEPVESFATRYGDRIGIIGGVDMDILARGSAEQVRNRTRRILELLAPTGGYVLGSGNSIANYIPPQNFLAMLDEGRRFNK
jgi:uroporphyrinogen decarboxylase